MVISRAKHVRMASASRIVGLLFLVLTMSGLAVAQTSAQPTPAPTPRRALPKPVTGSRGFEQFAKREASARLIVAAGTRVVVDPDDHFSKGEAHYKASRYQAAVDELRQAIKLSPDWEDPHYVLGLSLTELGQLSEAIAEFKQVIELAIKDEPKILSYYNMGNAHADLAQYDAAIAAYQQAIKLNHTLSRPHNNLGLAYAAQDRFEEAVAEFKQAVKLRSDYAQAHYNLGVAYLQMGRKEEANEQQQILVKLKSELAPKLGALIEN